MYSDQPPPPPPLDMPPLPEGPPPISRPYHFGNDESSERLQHRHDDFTFHPGSLAPQYPNGPDLYRPSHTGQYHMRGHTQSNNNVKPRPGNIRSGPQRDSARQNRGGGYRHRIATADRPLLNFRRGSTPERMLGMNDHQEVENRFLDIDDMSDSAEEAMMESDQEEYEPPLEVMPSTNGHTTTSLASTKESAVPLGKRLTAEELTVPRWSNPEYYTALPPPDESQRKRRDVVKLIRKARVAKAKDMSTTQAAVDDDFISFDLEEDKQHLDENDNATEMTASSKRGVPGAPSSPRVPDLHRRPVAMHAPGTKSMALSADALGPPPSNGYMQKHQPVHTVADSLRRGQKRKRSEEPESIDPIRPPKRKKGRALFSNGNILPEWESSESSRTPVPWLTQDQSWTEHPGFRLHKEICDFYDFVKPRNFEQIVREDLLARIHDAVKDWRSGCEVHCFGSFAAGLYLPNADMDIVVVSREFRDTFLPTICRGFQTMNKLARYLQDKGIADPSSVEIISKAKVPLIKFVDRKTQLNVDMSFENNTGLVANQTFQMWKHEFPAMPVIVIVIKQFLMMRGLNEVVNGGLGGFSVTCLVTSLLQNLPRVQTGELVPEHHLGEILLEFLDLYGNQLDIARTGIQMIPPGYFEKRRWYLSKPSKPDRLAIVDPNKPDNDISGGSSRVPLIFARFSRAREDLLSAMNSTNRGSLLDRLLGGNYDEFLWQRARLMKIHTEEWGSVGSGDVDSDTLQRPEPTRTLVNYSGTRQAVALVDSPAALVDDIECTISITSTASAKTPEHPNATAINTQPMEPDIRSATIEMAQVRYAAAKGAHKRLLDIQRVELKQTGKRHAGSRIERQLAFTRTQYWESISLALPAEQIAELASSIRNLEQRLVSKGQVPTSAEGVAPNKSTQPGDDTVFQPKDCGYIVLSEMLSDQKLWHSELWPLLFRSQYPLVRNIPGTMKKVAAKELFAKHNGPQKAKQARRLGARPAKQGTRNELVVATLFEVVASSARPNTKKRLLAATHSLSSNSQINPIVID